MSSATAFLVPLIALVLIAAALALARLLRSWRAVEGALGVEEDPELVSLEDEKQRILATLKDLDHEHALGKLSEADYHGLKRHFEHEALRVIDRLEALRDKSAEGAR